MSELLEPKLDLLGRELKPGQFVAFCQSNTLYVGRIKKVAKVMVRVERLKTIRYMSEEVNKYPEDCCIISEKEMTWWLIKNVGPKHN
jgi:hypothetical protein